MKNWKLLTWSLGAFAIYFIFKYADGLPYIGKSKKVKNMTFATGHAMMEWSLGPATGKLVTELVNGSKTSLDLNPFNVDRFS